MSGGFRSLELIKRSGSTSRILNLHIVHQRFGTTEAFEKQPLFRSKRLNSSMIMKHTVRGSETYLFADAQKHNVTKIILPFANDDLGIGGTNLFVGQKNFEQGLRDLAKGYDKDEDLRRDVELLEALAALPSLDPFLLRERLRLMGREPARCYFQISDADLSSMQEFVSGQVNRLIELALSGGGNTAGQINVSRQMASKILSDENAESLAPLKAALGLNGPEWVEGVFCWKGFLYYKWKFSNILAKAGHMLSVMQNVNFARCDPNTVVAVKKMRDRAATTIRVKMKLIKGLLDVYDHAFKQMTVDQNPTAFKDFLLKSPELFVDIGEHVGVASHLTSFWGFKFGANPDAALDASDLLEVFREFDRCDAVKTGTDATEMVW
ncbi:MAG: hypothetical protein SGI91_22230 [Alphaproteobacteria bacterium]|nr:hypothetical protein [Alphaproteobacteria bacterium]